MMKQEQIYKHTQRKIQWSLVFKLLSLKDIWLILLGLSIGFGFIFTSFKDIVALYQMLQQPAVIRVEGIIPEDIKTQLSDLESVEKLTPLFESSTPIQWKNHDGMVNLYAVESEYLEWIANKGDSLEGPISNAMPYIVVTQSVQEELAKTTKDDVSIQPSDLMASLKIGEVDTRIYGIIDDPMMMEGIYISTEWFEKLFLNAEGEQTFSENRQNAMQQTGIEYMSTEPKSMANEHTLIEVKHGYRVAKLITQLSTYNLIGTSIVTDKLETIRNANLLYFYLGIVIVIASLILFIYEEKLWQFRNQYFIRELKRFYNNPKIALSLSEKKLVLVLFIGIIGGLIILRFMLIFLS